MNFLPLPLPLPLRAIKNQPVSLIKSQLLPLPLPGFETASAPIDFVSTASATIDFVFIASASASMKKDRFRVLPLPFLPPCF